MGLASTQILICFALDLDPQPWVNLAVSRMALFSKIQSQCNFLWILTEDWVPNLSFKMPSLQGGHCLRFPSWTCSRSRKWSTHYQNAQAWGICCVQGTDQKHCSAPLSWKRLWLRMSWSLHRVRFVFFPFTVYCVLGNYKCRFLIVSNTLFKTFLLVKCRNQLKLNEVFSHRNTGDLPRKRHSETCGQNGTCVWDTEL